MFSYWHSVTHDCYQDVRPFLLQNMYWTQCHIIVYYWQCWVTWRIFQVTRLRLM